MNGYVQFYGLGKQSAVKAMIQVWQLADANNKDD
jgi:hypothetical protein